MSAPTKHAIRPNSVAAHRGEEEDGRLSRRAAQVIGVYARNKHPLRDREVMQALAFTDMNSVRPTITTLIEKNVLREVANVTDPLTNKTVRVVALVDYDDGQKQFEFDKKRKP